MSRERDLELALVEEIKKILKNDKFYNEKGELVNVNSYKHSLPNNYYSKEIEYSPYVISEVISSVEDVEKNEIKVVFTLCVCDGIPQETGKETINKDIHCEDDLFHIKDRIIERFKKNNILNRKYVCENKWQFALVDDNIAPYYLAGLTVNFTTAVIENEIGYN